MLFVQLFQPTLGITLFFIMYNMRNVRLMPCDLELEVTGFNSRNSLFTWGKGCIHLPFPDPSLVDWAALLICMLCVMLYKAKLSGSCRKWLFE